jgi:hypothetical protein
MSRLRRIAAGVVALVAAGVCVPRVAAAQASCDAGAACADVDRDGFVACGCAGAGTPCDCDDADPTVFPGAPEACDSRKDNDCSGVVADPCPTKRGCLGSVCVPECVRLDDFGCLAGSTFATQADGRCLCAPPDCTFFGCPPGSTCDDSKTCVPTCNAGVRCPRGQRCRGFGCVDACAEITCPDGGVCDDGRCVASCTCCPQGESCDGAPAAERCVETACAGVRCAAGSHCARGACVDDCEGVVCPPLRVCRRVSTNGAPVRGECVDLCSPSPCQPGFAGDWRSGACTPLPGADGGLAAPEDSIERLEVAGAGWLCTTSGLARASAMTMATTFGIVVSLVLRRRRRSRNTT